MKKMKKIILLGSILVLTVSLLLKELPVAADYTSKPLDKTNSLANINKYILSADESKNLYNIVLEIEGKNKAEHPPTDIVVVVDHSSSMSGERFDKTKVALKLLADKLLTDTSEITLGYVGFNTDVSPDLILQPTKNKTVFEDFVDTHTTVSGGSHMQSGLKKAREILEALPSGNQKIIIILSDGNTTYSYKPTSVSAVVGDEVRSYGEEVPAFKVDGYDYSTTIGRGSLYGLQDDTFKIGSNIVKNTGDPTIGELLAFKEQANHYVFSVGIELSDSNPTDPGAHSFRNERTSGGYDHVIDVSWDESIKDGIYNPNELIHIEATYTNNTGKTVSLGLYNNLVADNDTRPIPAKANDYIVNDNTKVATVYLNGSPIRTLSLDELISEANETFPPMESLQPNDVYKIVIDYKMKDFTLMGPGKDSLNTLHIAQFKTRISVDSSNISFTSFGYDYREFSGPILGFHSPYKTRQQGEYVLRNLSDDGINDSTYFEVEDIDNLSDTLIEDIYTSITDSIVDGIVVDPMGEYVSFVSGAMNGIDFKIRGEKDGINDQSLVNSVQAAYNPSTRSINVSQLNLSANERVFIEYQVELQTNKNGFSYDTWYDTNLETTLLPKAGESLMIFPMPQVKAVNPLNKVTLRYDANAGNDASVKGVPSGVTTHNLNSETTINAGIPTRRGYEFTHWEMRPGSVKMIPGGSLTMSTDIILYAQWKPKQLVVEVLPTTGTDNDLVRNAYLAVISGLSLLGLVVMKKE